MRTHKLKDFGIALSLANLCFFPVWAQVLPGAYSHYFLKAPPSARVNLATIVAVWTLATMLWGLTTLARRNAWRPMLGLARWTFLLVLVVTLNEIRQQWRPVLAGHSALTATWPFLVKAGLALAALVIIYRWFQRVIRAATLVVLILLPFVLVTCSQAAWAAIKVGSHIPFAEFADKPPAPLLPAKSGAAPRVLWLLFDGFDYRLTFVERPATLSMPNVDRFRNGACSANQAYSPAGNTLLSMPALITGRPVDTARPLRSDELMVRCSDTGETVGWSALPNLFSQARALGFNTAIAGFYHPYCRVIGNHLTQCSWETTLWGSTRLLNDPDMSVPELMVHLMPLVLDGLREGTPFLWRLSWSQRAVEILQPPLPLHKQRREHITTYLRILQQAKPVATDPSLGLVLVHWPVPHKPPIYDRVKGDFDWQGERAYEDNLALVDRTVGEMRRAMEQAGTWDTTTILITADHWFDRHDKTDRRVPFLLKLAGQKDAVAYDATFNTLLLHDLVLAVLRGEISNAMSAVRWLDQRRSQAPMLRNEHGNEMHEHDEAA